MFEQLQLASELESDLRVTQDWDRDDLIDFNTGKTQLVLFEQFSSSGAVDVKMNGSNLDEKASFMMLGLSFSSSLDFSLYIISTDKTASTKLGALIHFTKFLSSVVTL